MKKASQGIVTIAMIAGALVCVGCSSAPKNEVVLDNGQGKVAIGEQSLPADFPVSKYENGKVEVYTKSDAGGQKTESATITTKDSASTVGAFYKNWFTSNGWHVSNETNMGAQGTIMTAEKGTQAVQLVIGTDTSSGSTSVTIVISQKSS